MEANLNVSLLFITTKGRFRRSSYELKKIIRSDLFTILKIILSI